MDEGHCGLPLDELVPLAETLLEIPAAIVEAALELALQDGAVIADSIEHRPCIVLAGLHRAERAIAARLRALAAGELPWPAIDAERAIPLALGSKVPVITGGPGGGKTTLGNSILRVLTAKGVRIALAAPTGRAAKRLAASTGREARTIHRLLEADPASGGFRRHEEHPLECDLLVVDETSMVDVPLMHALLEVIPDGAALLLVGDVDQLPSVGPGQVLADIIAAGAVPVVRLTEVFRQAAQSRIVVSAHRINQGLMPGLQRHIEGEYYCLACTDPEDMRQQFMR